MASMDESEMQYPGEKKKQAKLYVVSGETAKMYVFDGVTTHDIPAERVLQGALDAGLQSAVVMGYDEDGNEYFASSVADGGSVLWLMERLKQKLINVEVER